MMILDKLALILTIVGALNWGSIGIFGFDFVGYCFKKPSVLVRAEVVRSYLFFHSFIEFGVFHKCGYEHLLPGQ